MLTPIDIQNKEFRRGFRGYDEREVDDFMRDVLVDYEKLYRENAELKDKNTILSESIGRYKNVEETMQNALMVAQHTAEDIKAAAYEKADAIMRDAQLKADEAIGRANRSITELSAEYARLHGEVETFKARMNSLLGTCAELLKDIPKYDAASAEAGGITIGKTAPQPAETPVASVTATVRSEYHFYDEEQSSDASPSPEQAEARDTETAKPSVARPVTDETGRQIRGAAAMPERQPEPETPAAEAHTIPHEAKVNPLVDELLRQSKKAAGTDTSESAMQSTQEVVLDFETGEGKNFDVFSEDPLD